VATKSPGSHEPSAPAAGARPRLTLRSWLVLALLGAVTFAAFAGVLRNGWILVDDPAYVYQNPHVRRGLTLEGARWFLSEPHGNNWEPLTACSHMLDVQLYGFAPAGHHATSLVLHILNALLVAIVLHRLTGAWWRSVLVAGLFALHPLRVESVAWIAERKDVLSGLFFWLALDAYHRWTLRPGRVRYAVLVAAFALGLMSKPMLVTLPFVLLLLDAWPLGRLQGMQRPAGQRDRPRATAAAAAPTPPPARPLARLVFEKWPLFAMAAASALLTFGVQRETGALAPSEVLPLGQRLGNALISYWRYVAKTAWPDGLAALYPYPHGTRIVAAVAAAAGLAVVTAVAVRQARRRPYLVVGWLWYVGTLLPVIGLVQTGNQAYADRFTYLPAIGLLIATVWGLAEAVTGSRVRRAAAVGAVVLALAALAVATARQVARWKDTRTLFTYVLAVTGDNPDAHRHLGHALWQSGRTRLAIPHLEASLGLPAGYEDHLRRMLSADPLDIETRRRLAAALVLEARVEGAIAEYTEILRCHRDDLDALNNVAWIRATHEEAAHRDGAAAVRLAERAREASPQPEAVIYSTLAAAYAEAGRFPEAVAAGERAIALARSVGGDQEVQRYARQLRCYRAGRAFHFGE
jgi:protein O-mannosyl-transferase